MTAEHEQPRSLLFLSCDLVGSTAYKQRERLRWQRTFLSFYRQFPQALAQIVASEGASHDFHLWKAIGDEVIFTCEVKSEAEVFDAVRMWLRAMDDYERQSLQKESLGTKGGAFVATFPGPDSECSIPRDPSSEDSDKGLAALNHEALMERDHAQYQFDYFGPSIDTARSSGGMGGGGDGQDGAVTCCPPCRTGSVPWAS